MRIYDMETDLFLRPKWIGLVVWVDCGPEVFKCSLTSPLKFVRLDGLRSTIRENFDLTFVDFQYRDFREESMPLESGCEEVELSS